MMAYLLSDQCFFNLGAENRERRAIDIKEYNGQID